ILSGGSGELIKTGQLTVTAAGAIGTSTNRLNVLLVQSASEMPVVDVSALGNVYLTLSAFNLTSNALVINSTSLTRAVIDVTILGGLQQATTTGPVTPQTSSYRFSDVSASTQLDVAAGASTPVDVSFTGLGDLRIDSVTSFLGDVSLTAGGAIITT